MKSPLIRTGLIALAAASLTATAAYAETQQHPIAQRVMAMRHKAPDPAERAQHLRDALQLTSAQEPALQAFIAATARDMPDPDEMREHHQEMAGLTTPERLDRMAAMMAEHQKRFNETAAATKKFYAALTPSQKKAFDTIAPEMMKARMGGHHGMRGGGMGMGR